MSSVKSVVIAAAGFGSRLGLGVPKCLLEVGGETLLFQQLKLLEDIENIVLVVGYMEERVMEQAFSYRKDIIIVRNTEFRNNTTRDSYSMGARAVNGKCIFMDADLIINPDSFKSFLISCEEREFLVGVSRAESEDCVFAQMDEDKQITGFSRDNKSKFEWCNVVLAPSETFAGESGWVYERLAKFLPLPSFELICSEIDTQADLDLARQKTEFLS